jgi:stage II sporulation protein AB (anti-sigma F factor)
MKFDNYMILEFPSKSCNEAFARSAVSCFAAQMDPTIEELGDIRTAVSEAVTNAIVHGYPKGLGIITLRCRILKDNVLDIVIKDRGVGIADVEKARQPMFTTGGTDRSGMGITIMESFMTELEITSKAGKGTTVHMRRRLQRRQ